MMTQLNTTRYYAAYNPNLTGVIPVAAWYDAMTRPDLNYRNPGFLNLTVEQWNNRNTKDWAVENDNLVEYLPTPVVIPIEIQSKNALSEARTYVYNNYGILNEATPDDWVTYIKALMAISNGTDTTSTILPTQPAD